MTVSYFFGSVVFEVLSVSVEDMIVPRGWTVSEMEEHV